MAIPGAAMSRDHTDVYTGLSCERPSAPQSFYFRTKLSNNVFQVKYLSHVQNAPKNFAVCQIQVHFHNIIN
jgi:hypothetical protein